MNINTVQKEESIFPFLGLQWLTHFSYEVTVVPVFQKRGKYKQDTNGVHFYVKCGTVTYCFSVQMNGESFEAILFYNPPFYKIFPVYSALNNGKKKILRCQIDRNVKLLVMDGWLCFQ